MKTIYLIRHSAPFVEIENYEDFNNTLWKDINRNMILSTIGEENAKKLCNVEELNHIDAVYSSDSFRSIGTAKYIAEKNHCKIRLDKRMNERELGVEKIQELPDNYNIDSFQNKDFKIGFGESINEVNLRFNNFMNEIIHNSKNKIALFVHGILLMAYLQEITDFEFDGMNLKVEWNQNKIYYGPMKNPMVFQLTFDNDVLLDIKQIEV